MMGDERDVLRPEPLTSAAFAPFGEVIEAASARQRILINEGTAERFHDLARIEPGADGRAIVSIFRGQPRPMPFAISLLERHPQGSQAFVPLSGRPYLVVVAEGRDGPDEATLRVFLATDGQGVNFAPGVWHHPLLTLDEVSDFLVIDRDGPGPNCDERTLTRPVRVAP